MPSIDEIMQRREEYMASKPQFSGGDELWLSVNDVAIVYSLWSGQEGDPYMEYYVAHEYKPTQQGGRRTLVYCPVVSGHDGNYPCQGCKEDVPTKDRFAMWLWIDRVLCEKVKQGETLPQEKWIDEHIYYVRERKAAQLWDTSAWRESPLSNILTFAKQMGDLRKVRFNLRKVVTDPNAKGDAANFSIRYPFLPEVGSPPLDAAIYTEAVKSIQPVRAFLLERIQTTPTVMAPPVQAAAPAMPQFVQPVAAPQYTAPAQVPAADDAPPTLPPFTTPETPERMF